MTTDAPGTHPLPEEVDALLDPVGGDARVEAHVARCEHCRRVREGLQQVRTLLGAQAREVPPEPPDLGARIAAALAAEPPLRAPAEGTPGAQDEQQLREPGAPVVRLRERRRTATTWLAVAASVAVVGLGGTFLATRPGAGGEESEAAGGAVSQQDAEAGSGQGGAGAPGAESGPLEGVQGLGTASGAEGTETAYTRTALAAQAEALVAAVQDAHGGTLPERDASGDRDGPDAGGPRAAEGSEGSGASEGSEGSEGSGDGGDVLPQAARSAVEECLAAVGRAGADPVATDVATFEGEPAAVLVLPDGRGYEVVVVPDTCGRGDDRVLATTRLD